MNCFRFCISSTCITLLSALEQNFELYKSLSTALSKLLLMILEIIELSKWSCISIGIDEPDIQYSHFQSPKLAFLFRYYESVQCRVGKKKNDLAKGPFFFLFHLLSQSFLCIHYRREMGEEGRRLLLRTYFSTSSYEIKLSLFFFFNK